jgi:processive 1,2-diacylglycerol beta-glucosyltransferase
MIQLRNKDTGALLGAITEEQLQFLIDQLEEEFEEDKDYYINRETVTLLEKNGADAKLMEMLNQALGDKPDMEIMWSRT